MAFSAFSYRSKYYGGHVSTGTGFCLVVPRGRSHTTRRCRGVTYLESYITRYTTYTKQIDGMDLRAKVLGFSV